MKALPEYYTAPEAAEELRLHVTLIQRYCKSGKIKATQVGSLWFIRNEDFLAFKATPRKQGNWFHKRAA